VRLILALTSISLQCLSSLDLKLLTDVASTTCCGRMFRCPTTLWLTKFFRSKSLDREWKSFMLCPLSIRCIDKKYWLISVHYYNAMYCWAAASTSASASASDDVKVRRSAACDRWRKSHPRGRYLQRQATSATSVHFRRKWRHSLRQVQLQIRRIRAQLAGHVYSTLPRYDMCVLNHGLECHNC